jgi:PAS domain S-box-containing protein
MAGAVRRVVDADALYVLLDAAPAAIVGSDSEGLVDYLNPQAVALFGYQPEELLGRPVEVLVPEERRSTHVAQRARFAARPAARPIGTSSAELVGRRKDGSVFPAEISLIRLETEEGLWVLSTVVDVSGRRRAEQRMETLGRAYLTLAELNQAIVRAPDEATLFQETCRVAVEHGGYLGAWVGKPDEERRVRSVASAGVLDEYIAQVDITIDPQHPRGLGPTGLAFREGEAQFSGDFLTDPRTAPWRGLATEYGIRASATLPLRCGGRTVAVLSLYSAEPDVFDAEMRSLLAGLAENVSVALDAFAAADQLRTLAAQRRALSRRLVAAQEEERARIAADVHDDSVQSLAAVDLRLGLLRKRVQESAPELVEEIEEVQRTVGMVAAGLRDLLFELESADTGSSLADLVREAARHLLEDTDIRCDLQFDASRWNHRSVLSQTDRGQALRIVKEALFNVRKHSGATHVSIAIVPEVQGVEITVRDDGAGFDVQGTATKPGHRGLANMRDRAAVAGGWCRIESGERGTTVRFWMPYDATAPPYMGPRY